MPEPVRMLAHRRLTADDLEKSRLRRLEIREKVYKLKLRGKSLPEIEKALWAEGITDVSMSMCSQLLKEHLQFLSIHDPEIKDQRKLEYDRYESLISVLWDRAHDGDLDAVNVIGVLMRQKSKLMGLDMPVRMSLQITPSMPAVSTEELRKKQEDLFLRLQTAGKIPSQLSFDDWVRSPTLIRSANQQQKDSPETADNVAIAETDPRTVPKRETFYAKLPDILNVEYREDS